MRSGAHHNNRYQIFSEVNKSGDLGKANGRANSHGFKRRGNDEIFDTVVN